MVYTIIEKNCYQDSITLMLLSNKISGLDHVEAVSIMMGTPANKDILVNSGFGTPELQQAAPNDMVVVVRTAKPDIMDGVMAEVKAFLADQSAVSAVQAKTAVHNWAMAGAHTQKTNVALFSIPGEFLYEEADTALEKGKHVFIFSDNVSVAAEAALKKKAHGKGLLVMGPDCGTGIIAGVPLVFANKVRRGNIGVAGASGTGIQEVTSLIHQYGGGVSHAIGTGGRDLSEAVGGVTMADALWALARDSQTEVITVISKPPAKAVRNRIIGLLRSFNKPSVVIFTGQHPPENEDKIYYAHTLEEAAQASVYISGHGSAHGFAVSFEKGKEAPQAGIKPAYLKGLYTGGTLAGEAAMLAALAFNAEGGPVHEDGYVLRLPQGEIIDLGDDQYTKGAPHPMIDPYRRVPFILDMVHTEVPAVVLLDVVLGYGSHENVASVIGPAIKKVMEETARKGRPVVFVASLCGTDLDIQDYKLQTRLLEEAGAIVKQSNNQAVRYALGLMGVTVPKQQRQPAPEGAEGVMPAPGESIDALLQSAPSVLNIGVKGFGDAIELNGGQCIQFDWKPMAGGKKPLIQALKSLEYHSGPIEKANTAVLAKIQASQPYLMDVVPAKEVIPALKGHALLHAGPPIAWDNMTSPMKGSCIGAVLFEGWADNEEGAVQKLERGEITFIPCHHVDAVGPMGGITSGSMPVLVVENKGFGNRAYCSLNEGIGAVLRFGAYSGEVIARLCWMRDVLGPVLGSALRSMDGGLNLNVMMAKAIAMGDEFHQRNIAASLLFMKAATPAILDLDIEEGQKRAVIRFLGETEQFFLNIMMAAAKAVMDSARKDAGGTVVTAMCRNGENFGIRISGMGDQWFVAPCNKPDGLYFSGYTSDDANADMGDSAITETFGVGGMAMIAAPAVTRFVGSGGFYEALSTSDAMMEICLGRNTGFPVPTWDFKGICMGIDARKVVETGILPVINTGIAHKKAGIGQIGAGTVLPPIECFEKAVLAYCERMGGANG